MSQQLITSPTANYNLFAGSGGVVLNTTPDASNPRLCHALILLGNGTNNLNGAGGNFQVTITIAGNTWLGGAQTYSLGTAVRACLVTEAFPVPSNSVVTITVKSPNSADTAVNVTCHLMSENSASSTAVADIQSRIPAALVSGRMDSSVGAMASGVLTATAIASDAITAAKVASDVSAEIAAATIAAGDVDGYTLEQALRIIAAGLAGKLSGASGTEVIIRAVDDSKARITATVDSSGNRSAVTLDATP